MNRRWFIRVGTKTTPRKQSVIKAAKEGRLEQRHLDYVMLKYSNALFYPLELLLGKKWLGGLSLREFVDNCIKDALIRINEYDPQYHFRSFLTKKIVLPELSRQLSRAKKEREAVLEYMENKHNQQEFEINFRQEIAKEFVNEALRKLKSEDEVKYEVLVRRHFDKASYTKIYEELKRTYTLSITSEASVRKIYERAAKMLKHIFRQLVRSGKYVDDDLSFDRGLKRKLHEWTTKKGK
ncbi:MAG: hypothetical protein AB1599_03345 [Planctomycetota bacterium]